MRTLLTLILLVILPVASNAAGNETITSYAEAKRLLYNFIYADHRITLYCGAHFDHARNVTLPPGFVISAYPDRTQRVETEHILPAENFGRAFPEWRDGAPICVDSRGRSYRGRKCAETNPEFRRMESDLHNLAPAIGAVNAARRNYRFGLLPSAESSFGSCAMKIRGRVAEPPDSVKGFVARTHLYMADAYASRYKLSRAQRRLFEVWNDTYPPDEWECERERRIASVQGNRNTITANQCP